LGKTTLPALSSVKVVVIDVIIQWHLALENAILIGANPTMPPHERRRLDAAPHAGSEL
jgi:hypothetical protein